MSMASRGSAAAKALDAAFRDAVEGETIGKPWAAGWGLMAATCDLGGWLPHLDSNQEPSD
jgi:hypothetical protein